MVSGYVQIAYRKKQLLAIIAVRLYGLMTTQVMMVTFCVSVVLKTITLVALTVTE